MRKETLLWLTFMQSDFACISCSAHPTQQQQTQYKRLTLLYRDSDLIQNINEMSGASLGIQEALYYVHRVN